MRHEMCRLRRCHLRFIILFWRFRPCHRLFLLVRIRHRSSFRLWRWRRQRRWNERVRCGTKKKLRTSFDDWEQRNERGSARHSSNFKFIVRRYHLQMVSIFFCSDHLCLTHRKITQLKTANSTLKPPFIFHSNFVLKMFTHFYRFSYEIL